MTDTKKAYLDQFVRGFAKTDVDRATRLLPKAEAVTAALCEIFTDKDPLLTSTGMVSLYYLLARSAKDRETLQGLHRTLLVEFNQTRDTNRQLAEKDIGAASYELLEFDRLAQSPNDQVALEYRLKVLRRWVRRRLGRSGKN